MRSEHVSVVIRCTPERAYRFARDPEALSSWASGLASGVSHDGDELVVESPMGSVRVRFARDNEWGVLDHDVALPGGEVVANPFRIVAHPDGAEAIFTVRQRDMSEERFVEDCAAVLADLTRLKGLLENS